MAGKLATYAKQNRALRKEKRELAGVVDELSAKHNPSMLRKFIGVGIKDGTAYGFTRGYVALQQRGWAPKSIPLDVIFGTVIQSVSAIFDGPVSSFFGDVGDGIAEGGYGRLATLHQLTQSEVAGKVCLLMPGDAANGNGGSQTGS